jgi:hypothetical protein
MNTFQIRWGQAFNPPRHFAYLVGLIDTVGVAVGIMSDSGGFRVGDSKKTGGGGSDGAS